MKGKLGLGAVVVLLAAWFVSPWEGNEPVGYRDIVGVATACTGHTGPDVKVGTRYTAEKCREWLESDVGIAVNGVQACVHVPMKSYEWAAFSSLAFNIGVSAFCRSSIARKANAGDMEGACNALALYVYAGGKRVRGLENRRKAEIELCRGNV